MSDGRGSCYLVEVREPETVCCPSALLASALLTVGVPLHPAFPFRIEHEEIDGQPRVLWRWVFAAASGDDLYQTPDLIKWWSDDAWLAANPQHEWTILRTSLLNFAEVARRIRTADPRIVIRRHSLSAHIPASASPARRQHLLDQLEGRIPVGTAFVEPAPTTA